GGCRILLVLATAPVSGIGSAQWCWGSPALWAAVPVLASRVLSAARISLLQSSHHLRLIAGGVFKQWPGLQSVPWCLFPMSPCTWSCRLPTCFPCLTLTLISELCLH
ncbi:unnamed protein product, partial [Staurois parvus]